jgi:hypothetical protein
MFLLACSALLSSCSNPEGIQEYMDRKEEPSEMIEIKDITITKENLTLDFRVPNPCEDDIRVCCSTWAHGKQDVQKATTRIAGEKVWIKLCFNTEKKNPGFVNPPAMAKHVLLRAGESFSGSIPLDLPIRDYSHEPREGSKDRKQIVLHRGVFEIGYLRNVGPKWNKLLDSWSEKLKKESIRPKPRVIGSYYCLPISPLVTQETLDGRLRELLYIEEYTSLKQKVESEQVVITDITIPCSVVVEGE